MKAYERRQAEKVELAGARRPAKAAAAPAAAAAVPAGKGGGQQDWQDGDRWGHRRPEARRGVFVCLLCGRVYPGIPGNISSEPGTPLKR